MNKNCSSIVNWVKSKNGNLDMSSIISKEGLKSLEIICILKVTYKAKKIIDFKTLADLCEYLNVNEDENICLSEYEYLLNWYNRTKEYRIYNNLEIEECVGNIDGTTNFEGELLEVKGNTLKEKLASISSGEILESVETIENIEIIRI